MKCLECGGLLVTRRENHKYPCGLPYVTLENIEVRHCKACGETSYVIPKIEKLHRVLALMVIEKQGKLTGDEIRFLRKYLGWSGADFAWNSGVTPETTSRWENGHQDMGPAAERLLRLCVLHMKPVDVYPFKELETTDEKPKPVPLKVVQGKEDWEPAMAQSNISTSGRSWRLPPPRIL